MKPTRFASSAPWVLQRLARKCDRSHTHKTLLDGRAAAAAVYPHQLCRALIRGISKQLARDGKAAPDHVLCAVDKGEVTTCAEGMERIAATDLPSAPQIEDEEDALGRWAEEEEESSAAFTDAITGEPLPLEAIRRARKGGNRLHAGMGSLEGSPHR